ncbi:hypothetical protein AJ87_01525 [Rhizobium yanglingense]|nr:hypothetical protein AJ87_01525 [Rhizobium yanglingense]
MQNEIDMRFQVRRLIQRSSIIEDELENQHGDGRSHYRVGECRWRRPELPVFYTLIDEGLQISVEWVDELFVVPIDDLGKP